MKVIAHHRKGQAINGKDRGQELQTISNPSSPVFERLPSQRVFATQERTSNTSRDAVEHLDFCGVNEFTTSLTGHRISQWNKGKTAT
jgi:hypothetical protein